ncbi:hypothetical protein MRB53_040848 [Persea americana]|nr:hypothetical protein MRB53_040848 [Persea americana]
MAHLVLLAFALLLSFVAAPNPQGAGTSSAPDLTKMKELSWAMFDEPYHTRTLCISARSESRYANSESINVVRASSVEGEITFYFECDRPKDSRRFYARCPGVPPNYKKNGWTFKPEVSSDKRHGTCWWRDPNFKPEKPK